MLSSKVKDFKHRKLFLKIENNKLLYKFALINLVNNPLYLQSKSFFFLSFLNDLINLIIKRLHVY